MDQSSFIDNKIEAHSQYLSKLFENSPLSFTWSFTIKGKKYFVEAKCIGPTFEFHAQSNGRDFYQVLDIVYERLEKQMEKKHSKWKDKKVNLSADKVVDISLKRRERQLRDSSKGKKRISKGKSKRWAA